MQIWKRACLYLMRKRDRSLCLFLLFFAAGFVLLIGLSVRGGAKEAAGTLRNSLAAGLTFTCKPMDPYKMADIGTNEQGETVLTYKLPLVLEKEEDIEKLLAVDGVSGFYAETESLIVHTDLTLVPGADSMALAVLSGKIPEEYEGQREYLAQYQTESQLGAQTASAIGVYESRWHPAFVNGAAKLVSGTHIGTSDRGKVIISDELAAKNGLHVGDKLTLQSFEFYYADLRHQAYGSVYEAEIAGIFHINFEQPVGEFTKELQLLANMLFGSSDMLRWYQHEEQVYHKREITAQESERHLESFVLFAEDPALLDEVGERLLRLDSFDWKYYDIETYDKDYQTAAAPLLWMIRFSGVMIAAAAAGVFLLLFRCLKRWMRSRSFEISILISLGLSRRTIWLQFVMECCFMAAAAFPAAALLAGPAAKAFGNGLWTLLYSMRNSRGYEVFAETYASVIEVNMLPVKGEPLSYAMTPGMLRLTFGILMGMAAVAALASSAKEPESGRVRGTMF